MFEWLKNYRQRQKERDALVKIVDMLREEDRQMKCALVRMMCGTIDPDTVWIVGQRYCCHQCGRRYTHDRRCLWGLCRRCS